jgi:tetratricopeptide (TPR) repeat protein
MNSGSLNVIMNKRFQSYLPVMLKSFSVFLFLCVQAAVLHGQSCQPRYGKDSVECVKNLSLFNEYFKQGAYADAYESWKWVFEYCPGSSKNIYVRGVVMLDAMLKAEKEPGRKRHLLDTLLQTYDKRIRCFGDEGFVLGEKGLHLYDYANADREKQQALEMLSRSVSLQGNKASPRLISRYFQLNVELYHKKLVSKEQILDLYDQLASIIEYNLENSSPDAADYEKSRNNIENFFGSFANCEDLISIYSPRLKSSPDDRVLIKKIVQLFERKKCLEAPIYLEATEKLYKSEPTASSAASLARMYTARGNYLRASALFNEAIDLDTSVSKKALYHLELAELNLHKLKNYPQARVHAQRAAALRNGWGRPYLTMGDIYVAAAAACGDDDFKKSAVYWAAIDKYQHARNIDPFVSEEATKRITTYSRYFPDKENLFFRGLKEGDTFLIDYCWINESTTVRLR